MTQFDSQPATHGLTIRGCAWLGGGIIIVAVTAWHSTPYAAAFVALTAMLVFVAARLRKVVEYRFLSPLLLFFAGTMFWFASVDRYATIEFCQRCPIHHFQYDYRFLGISVYVEVIDEHDALVAQIASDLGLPCVHEYVGFPLARRWGLLYYQGYSSCICCLVGPDHDYVRSLRPKVLKLTRDQPGLKDEFYDKVVVGRDWKYLQALVDSLRKM